MIYVDSQYCCHVSNPDGAYRQVETDFFQGKCDAFVEGYRFVPQGESWTSPEGAVFRGEMVAPWKPYSELDAAQREYEREQMADMENALEILLGGDTV